jgi:hypothetical protein
MRASLRPNGGQLALWLQSQNAADNVELKRAYQRGHLHFVCKTIRQSPRSGRTELMLVPSAVRWKRPARAGGEGGDLMATPQEMALLVDLWAFWLDRDQLPDVTPAEMVKALKDFVGVWRAYEDIHARIDDAHAIAQRVAARDASVFGHNVWHVALDEVARLTEETANLRRAGETLLKFSGGWQERAEHAEARLATVREEFMARGFHAPTRHYWYQGRLVEAPPGVHGERCDKCEPALAPEAGREGEDG